MEWIILKHWLFALSITWVLAKIDNYFNVPMCTFQYCKDERFFGVAYAIIRVVGFAIIGIYLVYRLYLLIF